MDYTSVDFDWSMDPQSLRDVYKNSKFDSRFCKQISKDVIRILSPQLISDPHNLVYNEELFFRHLIGPLEKYICDLDEEATQENVDQKLQYFQQLNQPSKICRRILKTGDVTFSCNDCGLDGTCVVCIDCFHKGAHKDHNYRMSNSDGGGCCDCGDVEAWKQNYACSDHLNVNQANLTLADFEDKQLRSKQIETDKKAILETIARLPTSTTSRYFSVCQASLHYARLLLSWSDYNSIPSELEVDSGDSDLKNLLSKDSSSKNYFTVLFNDEVHTYDHVISTLVKIVKCTKMTASIMASTVSREGRSLILNDNYKACKQVRDSIAGVRDVGLGTLKVEIIHGSVLAHQAFALKLIQWVRKMSSLCDAFRILTAYTLLGSFDSVEADEKDMKMVEKIMLSNTLYWKIARVEWNDLFVTTLLTEYSIKEQFARLITRNYPKLMAYFIQDDHDHSVSILTMTTQLYTVPSLICMLIEEENALSIISETLIDTCNHTKRENPSINFENRSTFDMHALKRGFYSISDLKHLIDIQPTKWTDQLRKNVIEAVKIFLKLLISMQGMDSVKRQVGQHLEYEPDWESGMTLQSRLIAYITRLVAYCSFDNEVLIATLKETQNRLLRMDRGGRMVNKELFGHRANCIQYDVSTSIVSVHLPLTRFAAALIAELMRRRPCNRVPYDESLIILSDPDDNRPKQSMVEIMEPSLRTEVMIAQFRSGMWRRNGYSLVNQILYFHGALMRKEMFDRDILVLQEGAATIEANEFMIHLLNKFQLTTWVSSDRTREPLTGPKAVSFLNDEEILTQTMSLGEEFLQLLLTIINERFRVGLGVIEEDDVLKNEIIQLLCINPTTRSDLSQKLYISDNELDCIKAVANLKRSTETSTGKYELKEEFYERFNPFFYHYSRRNQSNALDAQLKRKKNLGKTQPLLCCPPAKPVELTSQFRNLNELLRCDITLLIIKKILTRTLGPPQGFQECSTKAPIRFTTSDLQLDQCLHLIGLGLYEQEREPLNFNYLRAAHEKGIFSLLAECYEKAKRSKDLIFWLMRKTNELIETLRANYSEEVTQESWEIILNIEECFKIALSACDTMKQENKKRNSELAAQRRERIMAQMKANQDKFLSNPTTKQLVADTESTGSRFSIPTTSTERMDCESASIDMKHESVAAHLCILCRDEQIIGLDQPTMVLLAYIQRSAVLSKNRGQRRIPNYALTPSNHLKYHLPDIYSFTSDNSWSFDATFMPADLFFGPQISSCGHVMHYTCWQGFVDALMKRETSRPNRNARHVSFELEKNEILCPLCECISNVTIPLLPNYTNFARRTNNISTIFAAKPETIERSSENLSACLHALRGAVDMFKHIRHIKVNTNIHISQEDKYIRLLQPKSINDVLEELDEAEALGLRDFINSIRSDKISSCNCTSSLLSSLSTLAERVHSVGLDLDRSITDVNHARIFMMTSWSISYTIQAFERVSRFKGSPLFEDIESPKNLCLSSLLRSSCGSMMVHQPDMMQSLLVRKLRYLLINDEHLSSSPCCLDIDAFEMFVSLFILLQKLYAHIDNSSQIQSSGVVAPAKELSSSSFGWVTCAYDHEYLRNILHLMLILNMLQVMISMQNELPLDDNQMAPNSDLDTNSQEFVSLHAFYKDVILTSGHPNDRMPLVNDEFASNLKHRLLPFLRSCAVFFYHLSQNVPPAQLRTKSAFFEGKKFLQPPEEFVDAQQSFPKSSLVTNKEGTNEEFNSICQYLDLPNNFNILLKSKEARHLARAWLRHSRVLILIKSATMEESQISKTELMPVKFIRQPHLVNRLIELPYDYSELVDKVSDFTCPSIKNEDSRTPTMCLVCGVMLCSQSYCCQRDLNDLASVNMATSQQLVGSCTYHAYECSGGVSVFLRIRNSQILLLSGRSKGCYMPAPYIDDHGETDFGLIRGNPLHLNRQHYEKLQQMWLNHAIPEQVSRTLEYSPYASSISWHLH